MMLSILSNHCTCMFDQRKCTFQDLLDSFDGTDFWYGDSGNESFKSSKSFSRSEDKWWVPVPCLPDNGLSAQSSKDLQKKRDCANQIHKAAIAINNDILAEMEVPESYITTLPKVCYSIYTKNLSWYHKPYNKDIIIGTNRHR